MLEDFWELEEVAMDGEGQAATEKLDDTYSRQLEQLPCEEEGPAMEKSTTLNKANIKLVPEPIERLAFRYEANMGESNIPKTVDDMDDWNGEADLVGLFDKESIAEQGPPNPRNHSCTAWQLPQKTSQVIPLQLSETERSTETMTSSGIVSPIGERDDHRVGLNSVTQESRNYQHRNISKIPSQSETIRSNVHHPGWSGTGERSPVLKKQMFDTGETPGCDAVYLNAIKDEQCQFDGEESEEEELVNAEKKPRVRNPFIEYEAQVGPEKSPDRGRTGQISSADDAWARGRVTDENAENLQPVKIAPPRPTFSMYPPIQTRGKKRRAPDQVKKDQEEMGRIEDFFERRAKQLISSKSGDDISLGGDSGNYTLGRRGELSTIQIDFKMTELEDPQSNFQREGAVVGKLVEEDGWVVTEENCLALLSAFTLREAVLNHSLQASHILPLERLPNTLELEVAPALQEVAMSLTKSRCPPGISDKRLLHNGLQVEVYSRQEGAGCCLKLTGLCRDLNLDSHQGQDMVKEVLTHIGNGCDRLEECRPVKVREHLVKEASRVAREAPGLMKAEVEEMLSFCRQQEIAACPHDKPILTALCEINT